MLISAFIIFNLVAIPFSSSKPAAEQNAVQRFFLPYLRWTRLLQSWPLFVPSPRKFAQKYFADITFKDGSHKIWQRPYPPNWDFFARHLSYSFQKWDLASNYLESRGPLWDDLAHYLQRLYANPSNPPEIITFMRSTANWPPPNETGYVRSDERLLQWTDQPVFTYHVTDQRIE
jgi:hypothetical protein